VAQSCHVAASRAASTMIDDINLAQDLLLRSEHLRGARIRAVAQLAGDMSTRRYVRVALDHSPVPSVLLVVLSGAPGPVGGGPRGLTQDDTYCEVSKFLSEAAIRVPEIVVDGRERRALLLEDVGNVSLLTAAQNQNTLSELLPAAVLGADPLFTLFAKALELQGALMQLKYDDSVVVYQRRVTDEQRAVQIREFLEYYARPRGLSKTACAVVERLMDRVCCHVAAHPQQVAHFDFMAANIHVLPNGELCLIDFQDMCLDSPARDVVSLLNDRGMDEAIGCERQQRLLAGYLQQQHVCPTFAALYDEYLLLWDFRVSGRFALLAEQRGVTRYATWIPGTLGRLGRTLARLQESWPEAHQALVVLTEFSPEIERGSCSPWGGVPIRPMP
jgi:aminoglycoside/choline kinase family phosphotransferase